MTHEYLEKMRQVENLENTKDIQTLLNEAFKIMGNPIVMFDTNYNLISSTENVATDDIFWNEIIKNGQFSVDLQELFKEEGFIDAMADAGAITFLLSDQLKYDRMSGKVLNRAKVHVASLLIVACNRKFDTEDPVIFEAVCKTVSTEISSSEFYLHYGNSCQDAMIKKLLEARLADKELYSAQMAILYHGLGDNLFLAVIDATQGNPEPVDLARIQNLLLQIYPAFKYSLYSSYIVAIISSDSKKLNIRKDLNKLDRLCSQKNIYAGLSRRFENLFELPKCYHEAVKSLKYGLISDTKQRIFLYDEGYLGV